MKREKIGIGLKGRLGEHEELLEQGKKNHLEASWQDEWGPEKTGLVR
jgi:hypothetical protein